MTIVEVDGITTQVGIVSWGSILGCGSSHTVNTRVSEYLDWIAENTDYNLN